MSGIVKINDKGIKNLLAIRDFVNKKAVSFTLYSIEPQVVEKLEVLRIRESFDLYGEQYIGEFIPAC
jgi:anti-anti-sigma regulatory factor